MKKNSKIVIIGSGWAGLSCSAWLAKQGISSTILEAAPQPGGRARSINFNNYTVDNGQHLLIGAYSTILSILKDINVNTESIFKTSNFKLITINGKKKYSFELPKFIYPLNLLSSIFYLKNYSWKEKFLLLQCCIAINFYNFKDQKDISVKNLLIELKQTKSLITNFWEPIALAAMSTSIEIASAKNFINVIKKTFSFPRKNSDLLFTKVDLGNAFPYPILNKYKNKINLLCNSRANAIQIQNDGKFKVITSNKEIICDIVVLATTPVSARAIINNSNMDNLSSLNNNLEKFEYELITTIYYELDKPVKNDFPMYGVVNGIIQWVFNRDITNEKNIISAVITGDRNIFHLSNYELASKVFSEICALNINVKTYKNFKVIKEKRAAFSCKIDIDNIRPENKTDITNLYIAGDYTNTGYPATLEGAAISGKNCAQIILSS